jgi:hypothetical protein
LTITGFGYDEGTGRIIADDEAWDRIIAINPKAKPFRTQGLKFREELDQIFGGTAATSIFAQPADLDPDDDPNLQPIDPALYESQSVTPGPSQAGDGDGSDEDLAEKDIEEDAQSDTQIISPGTRFKSTTLTTTVPTKRAAAIAATPRPKKNKGTMLGVFGSIATTLEKSARETSSTAPSAKTLALRTLQAKYPNLDDDDFLKAIDVVEAGVETFNALTGARRDAWLKRKIQDF